ncbi:SUMO ligase siz1 [Gonapodya sp. JEL0774]|nr:SUMO ligase siz1 [Gonapodya sp. JEL0774]
MKPGYDYSKASSPSTLDVSSINAALASSANRPTITTLKPSWSPYYDDVQPVSPIAHSSSFMVKLSWSLDAETSRKMMIRHQPPNPTLPQTSESYRLLFCMTAETTAASGQALGEGVATEYPPYPNLNVNSSGIQPRFAGLKNKPYTAYPADITDFCHRRPGAGNTIEFRYQNSAKSYVACVCVAKKLTVQQAVQRIKNGSTKRSEDVKRERLKKTSSSDELEEGVELLTLKDPVSKTRITVPMRASTCRHLQCFDGETFLTMNERSPNWTCPICHRPFDPRTLIIDGWFAEVLEGVNGRVSGDQVEQVEVDPSTLEWKVPEQEMMDLISDDDDVGLGGSRRFDGVEVVNLDSDEDDVHPAGHGREGAAEPASQSRGREIPRPRRDANVIDLTLDSDSDEERNRPESRPSNPPAVPPLATSRPNSNGQIGDAVFSIGLPTPAPSGSHESSSASTEASRASPFSQGDPAGLAVLVDALIARDYPLGVNTPTPGQTTTQHPMESIAPQTGTLGRSVISTANRVPANSSLSRPNVPHLGYPTTTSPLATIYVPNANVASFPSPRTATVPLPLPTLDSLLTTAFPSSNSNQPAFVDDFGSDALMSFLQQFQETTTSPGVSSTPAQWPLSSIISGPALLSSPVSHGGTILNRSTALPRQPTSVNAVPDFSEEDILSVLMAANASDFTDFRGNQSGFQPTMGDHYDQQDGTIPGLGLTSASSIWTNGTGSSNSSRSQAPNSTQMNLVAMLANAPPLPGDTRGGTGPNTELTGNDSASSLYGLPNLRNPSHAGSKVVPPRQLAAGLQLDHDLDNNWLFIDHANGGEGLDSNESSYGSEWNI